jgi:FKBP-type peptidyl-prolyl cis-trans isomerase SlyD
MDDKTLTVDGNNPLCGRDLIFRLEILTVRDASLQEIEAGTRVVQGPDIDYDPDKIIPI